MTPMVSLITPTYQAGPFLEPFLASVLNQSFSDMEFILVNDGSTDRSEAVIQSFLPRFERKGIRVAYLRQAHANQCAAFNLALPRVRGKYLAWADSDDLLHPDNVQLRVEYMENTPGCRMLRCNALEYCEESGTVLRESATPRDKRTRNIFSDLFCSKTYCLAGCYMLESSLFRECYPDLTIPDSIVGQNLQMLLPPASRAECHYLDNVLLTYRRRPGSHFHSVRTLSTRLARQRALAALLQTLTEFSVCEREAYCRLAREQEKQGVAALLQAAIAQKRSSSRKEATP